MLTVLANAAFISALCLLAEQPQLPFLSGFQTLATPIEMTLAGQWAEQLQAQVELDSDRGSLDAQDQISQLLSDGNTYQDEDKYSEAIAAYQQAISLIETQSSFDPYMKVEALLGLGTNYRYTQSYEAALDALGQALDLVESIDETYQTAQDTAAATYPELLIDLFRQLGAVHQELSNLGEALRYYQRGIVNAESPVFDAEIQAILRHNAGGIEAALDDETASVTLQEAIEMGREAGRSDVEASAILTLAWVAENAGDLDRAIALYNQAIDLFQAIDTPDRLTQAYGSLAQIYIEQKDYDRASAVLEKGYALDFGDRENAYLLNRSGQIFEALGDREAAWQSYRQALKISQELPYTEGQINALFNLGDLLESQHPELTIFFYKQAIAQIERIRQDITKLSEDQQEGYRDTVEEDYRHLADLLLQQNREAEALQILELLKLQEISGYLRDDPKKNGEARLNNPTEITLQQALDSLSPAATLDEFLQIADSILLAPTSTTEIFDSQMITELRRAIAAQPVPTAVLYPIILEDRLETLLITPDGTIQQFQAPVSETDLSATINALQSALKQDILSPTASAQQLYGWLIDPIESTLISQQVQNIIYLPDGILRYVPLAAFHDGNQWLAQKYQSHNITAATVDDLTERHPDTLHVLAGAFTDPALTYQIDIGKQSLFYSGLKAARREIDNLTEVADTQSFFDQAFTPSETLNAVGDRSILHLATHAQFVAGQPEDSFILFGNGSIVNLTELRQWELPTVELVVLSACQTATSTEGEGKEILGLGYQIQQTGASAVVASLWSVDDTATAALMNQFYIALAAGESKAQALRTAQQALIESEHFSDPFHWGAFILIGNGL